MVKNIGGKITNGGTVMNQDEAEKLIKTIYTPEKKKIWDKEMNEAGIKFENEDIDFDEYMQFRSDLRKRLGYPA